MRHVVGRRNCTHKNIYEQLEEIDDVLELVRRNDSKLRAVIVRITNSSGLTFYKAEYGKFPFETARGTIERRSRIQ